MTTPKLGRLTTVLPRDVWVHEAHDFTLWLLQNVDVLSDLLGMDLVLDVAEHPVGGFSLDLMGRDLSDDSLVIVENQLAQSDHVHLGQILTYAAGTNPKMIVWITTGFRPEHRAALDWLNEHTDPDTRFFGVEIDVVRIGTPPRHRTSGWSRSPTTGKSTSRLQPTPVHGVSARSSTGTSGRSSSPASVPSTRNGPKRKHHQLPPGTTFPLG